MFQRNSQGNDKVEIIIADNVSVEVVQSTIQSLVNNTNIKK